MRKEKHSPAQSIDLNRGGADSQLHLESPFFLDKRDNKKKLIHGKV